MSVYGSWYYGELAYSTGAVLDGSATASASSSTTCTAGTTKKSSATVNASANYL